MRNCIAPGCCKKCQSRKSRLSYFLFPKDPKRKDEWLKAIPSPNFVLKLGDILCEKHFSPDDIIRNKLMKDANGKIVQEINFKRPRLKEDAVPCLFPNCPGHSSINAHEFLMSDAEGPVGMTIQQEIKLEPEELEDTAGSAWSLSRSNYPLQNKSILGLLINDVNLTLPFSWSRVVPTSGPRAVFYVQVVSSVLADGKLSARIFKEISIDDCGILSCRVLGKAIDNSVFDISPVPLEDYSHLTISEIIAKVDAVKVCKGVMDDLLSENYCSETEVCEMDETRIWRHKDCAFLIPFEGRCDRCKRARKTLLQKQLRGKKRADRIEFGYGANEA